MNDTTYDCALTTIDNPFDPFEQFTSWLLFDSFNGYNCCGKIAQFANTSEDLSQIERNLEKEKAIDLIVLRDPANIYIKVIKQVSVA